MSGEAVLISTDSDVWTLTLNRPERKNALDLHDRLELIAALDRAESDPSCRAVVLAGSGGFFSAGGDIRSMSSDPAVATERLEAVANVARSIVRSSKPFVAAVQGGAFGLGLALAAACDYIVVGSGAKLGASFGKIGLIGDTGIHWSLAQRIGPGRAKELLLMSTILTAEDSYAIGLVSEVVEAGREVETAHHRANQLAQSAPGSVAGTKQIFTQPNNDLESVLVAETAIQTKLLGSADFAEGRAAFFERRPAQFGRAIPAAASAQL